MAAPKIEPRMTGTVWLAVPVFDEINEGREVEIAVVGFVMMCS
jgi:hypothetical protein